MRLLKKLMITFFMFFILLTTVSISDIYAAPSISNIQVWLNGDRAGELGRYYISFTNGDSQISMANGDKIAVVFPIGTIFSKNSLVSGAVKINNTDVPANNLTLDAANRKIEVTVPFDIAPNGYTLIEINDTAGIVNPTAIGQYQLELMITVGQETATFQSNKYNITGSQITAPIVTLGNTGTGKVSDYTIQFKGALVEGDIINILFPLEFVPQINNVSTSYVQINGKNAKKAEFKSYLQGTPNEKRRLEITVPNGVSTQSNSDVKITISSNAGITNPNQEGDYLLSVYTSRDIVPRDSTAIPIRNQSSNITVQLSPNLYREAGEYTIKFKTTGAVSGPNGYIELIFPNDTVVPATISNGHVLINNSLSRLVERDNTNTKRIRIYLANGTSMGANENVTLLISSRAGIQNPSAANNHTIQLRTSADQSFAASATYYTTGGGSVTPNNPSPGTSQGIKLSSYEANAASRYEIVYRTGSTGALTGGSDEISILFNNSTSIPDFIDREYIRVNSVPLDTGMVRISKQLISFRLPSKINIAANQNLTITIDEQARILHPNREGDYNLYVYTTKDGGVVSYTYSVKGQASYGFYVQPDYDANNQIDQYYMTFKTNLYGSLKGGYDWISISLPKALTRVQVINDISIEINGRTIDMEKVQVSGQTITFFVPNDIDISRDTEANIVISDPKKLISYTPITVNSNTVTFKIMTSKDNTWAESNPVTIFKPTGNVQPSPNQPITSPGTSTNPNTGVSTTAKKIQLYLNKKDAYLDGKKYTLEAAPYAVNGNTLVPLRFISEGLGAIVDYKADGQKITITYGTKYMVMTVNSDKVIKQGGNDTLPVPVQAINNRSFVPLRFISEWMGLTVEWIQKDQSIILQK